MRFWTAHADLAGRTRLIREGFSWGALAFGPLWFAAHRAWIPAALLFAAELALLSLAQPEDWAIPAGAALAVLVVAAAAAARDLVRWSLHLRGFLLVDVVAARDRSAAWQRLLDRRPDLADAGGWRGR